MAKTPVKSACVSACLVLLGAVFSGCSNIEVVTGTYATLDEARRAGVVERGWIPPLVPPGAHDIREAHDLDTNRRWGLFSFSASDDAALRAALAPGEISVEGRTCDIPRRIEWWPVMLRAQLRDDQIRATGLATYAAREERSLVVAVNWKQRRAYYWHSN